MSDVEREPPDERSVDPGPAPPGPDGPDGPHGPEVTRRDYELDRELVVDTPAQMKALGDPLRSTIVDLVLERAMSVSELAEILDRPRGSVAHHVDVLVDAGLIRVVRTRRVRAIDERLYGRAALTYVLPDRPGDEIPFIRDVLAEMDVERLAHGGRHATSTYRHARIPEHRAREFADRLQELALEFADEPRGGDTEFGLYLALFPTNRLPARRPHDEERDDDE